MYNKTVTLLAFAAMACRTGDAPMQLAYQLDAAEGDAFTATLSQNIAFAMGDHAVNGTRELRARYTIRGDRTAGHHLAGSVQLDTVRASMIWGQNQQRISTRHLAGVTFPLTVAPTGGAPKYDAETLPVIEVGGGRPVPASLLIDYGFPTLPTEPVTTGSTWSETRTNHRLEAVVWVTADVTTTYRVKGTTTIEGTRCLLVESESVGTLSDGFAGGKEVEYAGQLTGSATWCFDAQSGVLVEMIGEELTDGAFRAPDGPERTIKQTTMIEIHNVTASDSG